MTKLTNDTAFKGMLHKYITPNISRIMRDMVKTMISAESMSKLNVRKTMRKIANREIPGKK